MDYVKTQNARTHTTHTQHTHTHTHHFYTASIKPETWLFLRMASPRSMRSYARPSMVMATLAFAIFTSQTVAFRHGTFVALPHCSGSVCKPQEHFSLLPRRCHQGCIQLRAATQLSASNNPQNYKGPAKIGGVNLQTAYLVAGCSTAASWIGCAIFALATYTPWRVVHNSIGGTI